MACNHLELQTRGNGKHPLHCQLGLTLGTCTDFLLIAYFVHFFPNIAWKQTEQRLLVIASIREHINIKTLN